MPGRCCLFGIPYGPNSALPPGRYQSRGERILATSTSLAGEARDELEFGLEIDLLIPEHTAVDLAQPWVSPGVASEASSIYFLVRDPRIGPVERVWWDDNVADFVHLRVPVRNRDSGEMGTLILRANQIECGGAVIDFHAGRGAHDCPHQARLQALAEDNPALVAGQTYETPFTLPPLGHVCSFAKVGLHPGRSRFARPATHPGEQPCCPPDAGGSIPPSPFIRKPPAAIFLKKSSTYVNWAVDILWIDCE